MWDKRRHFNASEESPQLFGFTILEPARSGMPKELPPRWINLRAPLANLRCCIVFALTWTILAGHWPAAAQEQHVLALTTAGQASVAIDHKTETAYIVDLGRMGTVTRSTFDFSLDGTLAQNKAPLLDALAKQGVKKLVFICSHPHADHMGGILALFKGPRVFFEDDAFQIPRFKSITVIDKGVTRNLYKVLLAALPKGAAWQPIPPSPRKGAKPVAESEDSQRRLGVRRISAANVEALASISKPEDSVYMRTIPYTQNSKAGPNGRPIVTFTILNGQHSILDFDDAESSVIRQVVTRLKKDGIQSIDTFIVPHHGSKYQDIAPVFELDPKRAVITVNPRNQYRHPAPEILTSLIERLKPENVLFTGSIENVVLGPNGVVSGTYTAATRDSYALFVLPNLERAEKAGKLSKAERDAYDQIAKVMLKAPAVGPKGAGEEPLRAHISSQASMHTPEFDLAYFKNEGTPLQDLKGNRIFRGGQTSESAAVSGSVYLTTWLDANSTESGALRHVNQREANERTLLTSGASGSGMVELRFDTSAGFDNGVEPPRRVARTDLGPAVPTSKKAAAKRPLPPGGMVYLTGDKLYAAGAASALVGGIADLCGEAMCIRPTEGSDVAYTTPVRLDALFAEVWTRVYVKGIDAFYLSINPTKSFLREMEARYSAIPSDKLRVGIDAATLRDAPNEVVTAGDIKRSRIGEILWQADVLFKSRALGFDVLTGRSSAPTTTVAALPAGLREPSAADLAVEPEDRWCRLFWSSGSQKMLVDQAARRVSFAGNAVLAQAEAMVLHGERLQSEPKRTWCADVGVLAKGLEKEANSGSAKDKRLTQLRSVAEALNIARWARDNGVHPTEAFRMKVESLSSEEAVAVPRWTSGIRSDPGVLVQYEQTGRHTHIVHVSFSSFATREKCVDPEWEKHKVDFPRHDYTQNPATGVWKEGKEKGFIDKWMVDLTAKIANCAGGVVLPRNGVIRGDDEASEATETWGLAEHVQAGHYHGGVLLGARQARSFLEFAWKAEGALRRPDGHILFHRSGDDLHFWNLLEGESGKAPVAHHAVIHGGSIVDAYASEGRARFIVETRPGSVVRREVRLGPTGGFSRGLEWATAYYARDGAVLIEKAAWPCESTAANADECIEVTDMTEEALAARLGGASQGASGLRLVWVDPSTWLIDIDLGAIKKELDRRWEARDPADVNAALSLARAYANWGFEKEAETKGGAFIDQVVGKTEDTILASTVAPKKELEALGFLADLVVSEIGDQVEEGVITPAAALHEIARLEKPLGGLAPPLAARFWGDMAAVCNKALDNVDEGTSVWSMIENARARYERFAKRSRALATGSTEPITDEQEHKDNENDWDNP
jgi:beta-lactamase superfamily II metal-dependent hydrolase